MKTSLIGQFLPNSNQVFYNLFNEGADNTYDMAVLLLQVVNAEQVQEQTIKFGEIGRLKDKGYSIKHQVYAVSGKAFVSPFARDDMYALASAINSVSDFINISTRRINFYNIKITPPIKEFAGLIVDCCETLAKCIRAMNDLKHVDIITDYCSSIKQMEHYADQVYNKALSQMLDHETDTLEIIKYSEIFAVLERATDKCEHVVNVIESIIIKNT